VQVSERSVRLFAPASWAEPWTCSTDGEVLGLVQGEKPRGRVMVVQGDWGSRKRYERSQQFGHRLDHGRDRTYAWGTIVIAGVAVARARAAETQ